MKNHTKELHLKLKVCLIILYIENPKFQYSIYSVLNAVVQRFEQYCVNIEIQISDISEINFMYLIYPQNEQFENLK